jgi:hypothetical protein
MCDLGEFCDRHVESVHAAVACPVSPSGEVLPLLWYSRDAAISGDPIKTQGPRSALALWNVNMQMREDEHTQDASGSIASQRWLADRSTRKVVK